MRLWFNEAYRGTYQLIGQLREGAAADGVDLHVTGSHTLRSTPFLQACDDAFPEPAQLTGEDWVEHALAVCAERRIDVFVPQREQLAVARAVDRFTAAGVRVMVSPARSVEVLADKAAAHADAVALGVPVPQTHVVTDVDGFRTAYAALRAQGLGVCTKPAVDHGGRGFRVLDETVGGYDDLLAEPSARVHPDDVARRIEAAGQVPPLLVCEHLDGEELSVDVLSDDGEVLAAVPRGKGGPVWTRHLVRDEAALAIAATLVRAHGLRYLSNVQVRYGGGTCRLLEVNTRAASGLYQSAASGVNLPWAALRLLRGEPVDLPEPVFGALVLLREHGSEVELPW
ncbi:MAG: hypothetical protein JWN17_2069 [Frankiales bacterium]|nr:hypothetical protein [Frankiales bacterium]